MCDRLGKRNQGHRISRNLIFTEFKVPKDRVKMQPIVLLTASLILITGVGDVLCYKILGLFPFSGKSHFIMFESIMRGLAKRGHTVHVLGHYPLKTPLENYTDFSVLGSVSRPTSLLPFRRHPLVTFDDTLCGFLQVCDTFALYGMIDRHEDVMKTDAAKKLIDSTERYDLIVTESFSIDITLGFVHKFQVPFVAISTCILPPWTNSHTANPQNPAFVAGFLTRFGPEMTFLERLKNSLNLVFNLVTWYWLYVPQNQKIMRKYFADDTPPLMEIVKNVSLVLVNTHSSVMGSRPLATNVIEVGGIHIRPSKKLPIDIEKFIEDSPSGVIYFCLGSLLRAATLPEQKKNAFLDAFAQIDERILWKFEDENMTVPENVLIRKWMPQRDILAHPKVKLFISHGGLMGSLEAISEGKPILGMPMFGDQFANMRAFEAKGFAKSLDYETIDSITILSCLRKILEPMYAERAKQVSKMFHDRPMTPMNSAIYWIEYVIRNKGASHLRSAATDLSYFQYLLLDVIVLAAAGIATIIYLMYFAYKITFGKREAKKDDKATLTKIK